MSTTLSDPAMAGYSQVLDSSSGALYGELATEPQSEGPYELLKVGLDSGQVAVGPALPSLASLVVAEGYLWAAWVTPSPEHQPSAGILCQFDLTTMALVRQINLTPEQPNWGLTMAPGPDGTLLVGYGRSLLTVAPADGTERTITTGLDALVAFVATAPQGDVAYVTTQGDADGVSQVVDEVDLANGSVITHNDGQALSGVGPGSVTAVDNGVWLSWRTGMAGATVFLHKSDLSIAPEPVDPHPAQTVGPGNLFGSMMGESTIYADGVLWIAAGDGQLGCLDPSTGDARAESTLPYPGELLGVSEGGQLFMYYQPLATAYVLTLHTPAACFS